MMYGGGSVGPSESLFLDAQIPFSARDKKKKKVSLVHWAGSCTALTSGALSVPGCPRHTQECFCRFWRCTWILCSLHTPTHKYTQNHCMSYTYTHICSNCGKMHATETNAICRYKYLQLNTCTHTPQITHGTHASHADTCTHLALTPVQEHMSPPTPLRISVINQALRCRLRSTNTHTR